MKKQILKVVAQSFHTSAVAANLPTMVLGAGLMLGAMNVQADSEIGGEVEIDVSVENVICAAIGDDNRWAATSAETLKYKLMLRMSSAQLLELIIQ